MPTATDPFVEYLAKIEAAHLLGNDTEHTHRPAFKELLEKLAPGVTATNEPKRVQVGAPDYIVTRPSGHGPLTLGYAEAKDLDVSLEAIERDSNRAEPTTREGLQLKRYRGGLSNLLFTDYLEFRWYTNGERRQMARLANVGTGKKLVKDKEGVGAVRALLDNFLKHQPEPIAKPQELALRMARLTHLIRDIIIEAFQQDKATPLLKGWRTAFAQMLITDLDQPLPEKTAEFADMFAQTLAYGLFSARVMDPTPETFTRQEAQYLIPPTNPFLRRFFYEISGPDLDGEPYGGFVNDLAALLEQTDMQAVLADFGKRTRQEDPVVHFYETFLAAYDPKLRESRGVYYTPEPVVSYIVRSVDYLLKTRFGCAEGLADSSKVKVANTDPSLTVKGKNEPRKTKESHRVLILDPAVGTGTFLYSVVDLIRAQFMDRGNAGMWSDYVREHLLPRLFGFELLMAPYAVAHFKLGLQLAGRDLPEDVRSAWAYDFASGERLGVYLTNTLEGPHEYTGLPLFTQFLANETSAANSVKRDLPIMVVIGNPPYERDSKTKNEYTEKLLTPYREPVRRERNLQPLNNDYVKFIAFAEDRIRRTRQGMLAYISANSYLYGSTIHRGIRESLRNTFDVIFVLNLYGDEIGKGLDPKDQNVFDIQEGVTIILAIKLEQPMTTKKLYYAEQVGPRSVKYDWLGTNDVTTTAWQELKPEAPQYFFVPKNFGTEEESSRGYILKEVFGPFGDKNPGRAWANGVKSNNNAFLVDIELATLKERLNKFANPAFSDDDVMQRLSLVDTPYWNTHRERQKVGEAELGRNFQHYHFRPFDMRFIFYQPNLIEIGRGGASKHVMLQLLEPNRALVVNRTTSLGQEVNHFFCVNHMIDVRFFTDKEGVPYVFPLYLYPDTKQAAFDTGEAGGKGGRRPNLNPAFIKDVSARLGLRFVPDGKGDRAETFGPEDVFNYMYAVFHSPTYRTRYAEFLKIDFPRLPLTSDVELFRKLCELGEQIVGLHLIEKHAPPIASYPVPGDNTVEKVRYTGPGQGAEKGRVWINKSQYFEGVPPEVWEFHIGGYQVADKWLKDRKGRKLPYDDLTHYMRVVAALAETMRLMEQVDETIPEWPIL